MTDPLERTDAHAGFVPPSLEQEDFSTQWHFLAYCPAVEYECHLQKSQDNGMAVGWPRNYPARRSLSTLCTFKLATCVRFKRECRARSPGAGIGRQPLSTCGQRPSVLPASEQMATRVGDSLLHRTERVRGECCRGGSQSEPKPPGPFPCCTPFPVFSLD